MSLFSDFIESIKEKFTALLNHPDPIRAIVPVMHELSDGVTTKIAALETRLGNLERRAGPGINPNVSVGGRPTTNPPPVSHPPGGSDIPPPPVDPPSDLTAGNTPPEPNQ